MKSFDEKIAMVVGIEAAVLYNGIRLWCEHNMHNETHFHDGNWWSYNSAEAFRRDHPYWSRRKISRLIEKLESEGFIKTGNFDGSCHNRTTWYSCTEFQQAGENPLDNSDHSLDKFDQCYNVLDYGVIPSNKPSNKRYISRQVQNCPDEYSVLVKNFLEKQQKSYPRMVKVNDRSIGDGISVVDKLIRIDGYTLAEIKDALNFVSGDDFWSRQVLSFAGLRKRSKNGNTKFANILLSFGKAGGKSGEKGASTYRRARYDGAELVGYDVYDSLTDEKVGFDRV